MAAEPRTVNGNYGAHQAYVQAEPFQPCQGSNVPNSASTETFGEEASNVPGATPTEPSGASEGNKPPSKDEVGWYFVESYYTTLSKKPETLHLFYNKRSQFVSGVEAEKVDVCVGQAAIDQRIKELDFQDCKVRVSNVDSQESFKSIVIQVIGEISNKSAAHRKFVQTFVLAEQPKGYFVLNDIFRYIVEDEEEEIESEHLGVQEPLPALGPGTELETLSSSADPVQQQHDVEEVDKKLEQELLHESSSAEETPADTNHVNGHYAEDAPDAAIKEPEDAMKNSEQANESATVEEIEAEKPRDPDPTPVASPAKPVKAAPIEPTVPAGPANPAAPQTWASIIAAKPGAAPTIPNGSSTTATRPPSQPKAGPSTTNQSVTPPMSTSGDSPTKAQQNGNSGWQMAGSESNKKHGRQHSQSVSGGQGRVMAYVKNVTDKVDASILRTTLEKYENGQLPYFDVNRPKNCAFVEFTDQAAYNAAVAASPHTIGGEQIFVEERRPRASAYGGNFAGRGGARGGRGANEGRPGSQGRGGYSKDGGRGSYALRGRGGNMTPRGRGQTQAP